MSRTRHTAARMRPLVLDALTAYRRAAFRTVTSRQLAEHMAPGPSPAAINGYGLRNFSEGKRIELDGQELTVIYRLGAWAIKVDEQHLVLEIIEDVATRQNLAWGYRTQRYCMVTCRRLRPHRKEPWVTAHGYRLHASDGLAQAKQWRRKVDHYDRYGMLRRPRAQG